MLIKKCACTCRLITLVGSGLQVVRCLAFISHLTPLLVIAGTSCHLLLLMLMDGCQGDGLLFGDYWTVSLSHVHSVKSCMGKIPALNIFVLKIHNENLHRYFYNKKSVTKVL